MTRDELVFGILTCTRCPLSLTRNMAVPAEAGKLYRTGGLGILAEAPGAQEDATGRPMVGRAGQLLDRMLEAAGTSRKQVVILNRIRCRPPDNRIKSPEAIAALAACDPWLQAELEEYNPTVVLLMGATAMEIVFGANPKVGLLAGTLRATSADFQYGSRVWLATAHPAAVLRPNGAAWAERVARDIFTARKMVTEGVGP